MANHAAAPKKFHSIKVPRLYKSAASALKQVEENGEGLKNAIHSSKHPNVKAITALVSEALRHSSQLEVILNKSKIFEKEEGLSKQKHLTKILITELLWGKKRLGGESKPVATVILYQEKFDKVLKMLEQQESLGEDMPLYIKKPRYVRVNSLKMTLSDAISYLLEEGWNQRECAESTELGQNDFSLDNFVEDLLIFPSGTEFHNHPLYLDGSFVLQDKASCLPALALKPRRGRQVIDACAAPGMKTSLLAAITNNESPIFAVEKSFRRYETLKTMLDMLGVSNATSLNLNFTDINPGDYPDAEYILVDPSCSGSGMFGRLEIQIQRKSQETQMERILKLQYYQQRLLCHAMKFPNVKKIVYSTCSLNSEENEDVIAAALEWIDRTSCRDKSGLTGINWSFKVKCALPSWPHRLVNDKYAWADKCLKADESDRTDGFFVAVLERIKL